LILAIFLSGCGYGIIPPPIDNGIVYRALLIGIGDYIGEDKDLISPTYSVDKIYQILNQCRFGLSDTEFFVINKLKDLDATKSAILDNIASTFSGADDNDISYFYFTGHGARWWSTSYLCPTDATSSIFSLISINKLENVLSIIPGTKIVILDACHSGGFIGKEKNEILKEESIYFNDDIINIFSNSQSKSLLTNNQYKVLTSCCHDQISSEFSSDAVFTTALCIGCGYFNYEYPADINVDNKVSLQESYLYIKDWIIKNSYGNLKQDVQVYPDNSNYPIIEF
jgi:hypothetical protein